MEDEMNNESMTEEIEFATRAALISRAARIYGVQPADCGSLSLARAASVAAAAIAESAARWRVRGPLAAAGLALNAIYCVDGSWFSDDEREWDDAWAAEVRRAADAVMGTRLLGGDYADSSLPELWRMPL